MNVSLKDCVGKYKIYPKVNVINNNLEVVIKLYDYKEEKILKDVKYACYLKYDDEIKEKKCIKILINLYSLYRIMKKKK